MGTSDSKTIGQVLGSMGVSDRQTETRSCPTHGDYESTRITERYWTKCPPCDELERAKRQAEEQARIDREALERRFDLSNLPPRFCGKTFAEFAAETPSQKLALDVAQSYAKAFPSMRENGTCLAFCGTAGTGKTHLAAAIADEVIRAGYWVRFTSVMRAVRSIKETYRKDSEESEREALREFTQGDLLILDEVGVQFGSDTEKLILFEIINTRYEHVRPTIVISNLAKAGLEEFLGERAFDRLRENNGKLVVFDWPSYRRKAA